ncbi:GTP pyrophosphokinase [Candidatus Photodesmus katoptron]|uniref:GTP diphosphokinase n=1 Tax=Candidatus Photodesmus anomalopis TaxID=28176 RepID=UPI0004D54769|nr:GTP diphosphokinase [Candidatus Photodesmus katoptron]KEY90005.1 GTP pyrophosphokinase [Candidatus Photodesmus katoptron]
MVAIRNTHLSSDRQFDLEQWIACLGQNTETSKCLKEVYRHCERVISNHEKGDLLLWRGREMIEILITLSMDKMTLISAQLFPIFSSNQLYAKVLEKHYDKDIIKVIYGVKQMAIVTQLNLNLKGDRISGQIDSLRRMLLAMVEDFRCVLIKLAECIVNLLEVKEAPDYIRKAVSKECAQIYAPLASRLGIGQFKWEIEDYSFRYQQPDTYKLIARQLSERRIVREEYIKKFIDNLTTQMSVFRINVKVSGRPKHIYSIWKKMQKKGLDFNELFDVRAVRIIAETLEDCYAVLGIIHTKYNYLPSEFDDYIANPKSNGYQSIHTVILGPEEKTIEIQIRTEKMHIDSELGIAAHWKYKEGNNQGLSECDKKIIWLRKLLDWQEEMLNSRELFHQLRSQIFTDRVYTFTPKGNIVDLPIGSTPLDFAYHIHSEIGHRCVGVKVNGCIVPFTHKLMMGDQVEIITQREATPSRDWLNLSNGFIYSNRARSKINAWFHKKNRQKNIESGREFLGNELIKIGSTLKQVNISVLKRFHLNTFDELYLGVGTGKLRINQIINYINNFLIQRKTVTEENRHIIKKLNRFKKDDLSVNKFSNSAITVEGVDNLMIHLARCCTPIPGDNIKGYITQGRGISVHRNDCDQLEELRLHDPKRIINTIWDSNRLIGTYILTVRIEAIERIGLLRDIISILDNEKVKVSNIRSNSDYNRQILVIDLDLEVSDVEMLLPVSRYLEKVKNVILVRRL